jgi:hypothetical protein
MLDHLSGKVLEVVHLLLGLIELLEEEKDAKDTDDGGDSKNRISVHRNHIPSYGVLFLSNYTHLSLPWGRTLVWGLGKLNGFVMRVFT